jgi:hypothetical protein
MAGPFRHTVRPAPFTLSGWTAFLVASLPLAAAGQVRPDSLSGADHVALGVYGETAYWLEGASLVGLDLRSGEARSRDLSGAFRVFEPWKANVGVEPNPPAWYSSAIDTRRGVLWLWDRSVGATVRVGLAGSDTMAVATPRRSSLTQFDHAGGLHPMTGLPLAYGGFGYHRSVEFAVTYDDLAPTWVEIAYRGPARPVARLKATMVDGWHPTRVAIVGGIAASGDTTPIAFDRALSDAWTYDFADSTWTEIDLPPAVRCALGSSAPDLGDVAADPGTHGVLLYRPPSCSDHGAGAIIRWFPERGDVQHVGDLPGTAPDAAPLALYYPPDSASARMVFWTPEPGRPRSEWRRMGIDMPLQSPPAPSSGWPLAAAPVALGVLLLGAWGWVRRRRRHGDSDILVTLDGVDRITLRQNGDARDRGMSDNARHVIESLADAGVRAGDTVSADQVTRVLDPLYTDPDSLRVARNRAVDEINALFLELFGAELLERVRRSDDARRFDWRVRWTVRMER